MIEAGIIGASGYTGIELVSVLNRHPDVHLAFLTSESNRGAMLDEIHPAAPSLALVAVDEAPVEDADVVFLCLPHGVSAGRAKEALERGARVIDLSADFRIADRDVYEQWYRTRHPAPELLGEAVYGLTEFVRAALPDAQLVANPGCYPTSILIPLQPVLAASLATGAIIADSKSGVSGAGRSPKQHTHFVEVSGNFAPYSIGRKHRHLPEIEQQMQAWAPDAPALVFSPHLLPVPRGILSTIYVPLKNGVGESEVQQMLEERFANEPFIDVLPAGATVSLAHVNHTNRCVISQTVAADTLILTSAIDNLVKGAAGQAVQNMNVMFGLTETQALL